MIRETVYGTEAEALQNEKKGRSRIEVEVDLSHWYPCVRYILIDHIEGDGPDELVKGEDWLRINDDLYERLILENSRMGTKRKGPTSYQAKVWTDSVLDLIADGRWFTYDGIPAHYKDPHVSMSIHANRVINARQIGRYYPDFAAALESWVAVQSKETELELRRQAEKVMDQRPSPHS